MNKKLKGILNDLNHLNSIPTPNAYAKLNLADCPFDLQLLNLSSLYRRSRRRYLKIGGTFSAKLCSGLRGLSRQDLFENKIDFTPVSDEINWFREIGHHMPDAEAHFDSLCRFFRISIYHEQNHRILWALMPSPPNDAAAFRRYLNFAESVIITLDLALGDQIAPKYWSPLLRLNLLYRPGSKIAISKFGRTTYRRYLSALCIATYCTLEQTHRSTTRKVLRTLFSELVDDTDRILQRALELDHSFVKHTNPGWLDIHAKRAHARLNKIHKKLRTKDSMEVPTDPISLGRYVPRLEGIFKEFGL